MTGGGGGGELPAAGSTEQVRLVGGVGDRDLLSLQLAATWDSGFDSVLFPTGVRQRQESPSPLRHPSWVSAFTQIWASASAGAAFKVTVAALL